MFGVIVFILLILPTQTQAVVLSDLVKFSGESASDSAGIAVAAGGDVNGDGYDDMLIGAVDTAANNSAGAAYVIYGQADQLSSASLAAAVALSGETAGDWAGYSVTFGGDVNGDDFDDILIGALFNDDGGNNAGSVYLIYGQADQLSSTSLASAIEFSGEAAGDEVGIAIAGAGDLNHDAFDDILISARSNDDAANNAGAVYVIYGQDQPLSSMSLANATTQLSGEATGDSLGGAIAGAGDVNHDGYDDIVIGAITNDSGGNDSGTVYIVYGQATELPMMNLETAIQFTGENSADAAATVGSGGDVNGDGFSDFLIGAEFNDDGGNSSGAAYLIYGEQSVLSSANLSTAVQFNGSLGDTAGDTVMSDGDFNGDGFSDLIIGGGSSNNPSADEGITYLVYGQATNHSGGELNSELTFDGEATSNFAGSALATGDLNGDGFSEIVIGAYGNSNAGGDFAGAAYLGYLYIDADRDGAAGTTGLLAIGTDCDDTDNTVQTEQVFYRDADEDGLGDPTVTVTDCRSAAPSGYVANANDTNDTIKNNGLEIDNDVIDNDGDAVIDEFNTLKENGVHPEYGTYDPLDETIFSSAINSVRGIKRGRVRVRYQDQSVYRYRVFPRFHKARRTLLQRLPQTSFGVAVQAQGKRIALINLLSGSITDRLTLSSQSYANTIVRLTDFRDDDIREAVVVSQKSNGGLHMTFFQILPNADDSLVQFANYNELLPNVNLRRTMIAGNTVLLRTQERAILQLLQVDKNYQVKVIE